MNERKKEDASTEENHVCPWRHAYLFDNFLRRWAHNPKKLFGPYIKEGMTVLDIGCGMGVFSIGSAKLVGDGGKVCAVDLQPEMLEVLRRRAKRAGMLGRIETRLCGADDLDVEGPVDFAIAFYMVHETPDRAAFLRRIHDVLRPGGVLFVAEPPGHVKEEDFEELVRVAEAVGLRKIDSPKVRFSRAAVFERSPA